MTRALALLTVALAALAACGGPSDDGSLVEEPSQTAVGTATPGIDEELQAELVAMLERDQGQRLGTDVPDETDTDRTERLKEIIDEHGWPGYDLVGKEGEDAAWAIAQHSDLDLAFQNEALVLLRAAVEDGQASPGNLAYLDDRVAVAEGRPQTYGTQVSCGKKGPTPSTPIVERDTLEQRRADAGLDPFADYLTEMTEICSSGS